MSLGIIALFNNLLGVVCGLWFRVLILLPLAIIAFFEVAIFRQSETALSPIWLAIGLIVLIEIGYLIGASIALWPDSARGRVPRGFARPGYREMSIIPGE
jgi:hypothetical protein